MCCWNNAYRIPSSIILYERGLTLAQNTELRLSMAALESVRVVMGYSRQMQKPSWGGMELFRKVSDSSLEILGSSQKVLGASCEV